MNTYRVVGNYLSTGQPFSIEIKAKTEREAFKLTAQQLGPEGKAIGIRGTT